MIVPRKHHKCIYLYIWANILVPYTQKGLIIHLLFWAARLAITWDLMAKAVRLAITFNLMALHLVAVRTDFTIVLSHCRKPCRTILPRQWKPREPPKQLWFKNNQYSWDFVWWNFPIFRLWQSKCMSYHIARIVCLPQTHLETYLRYGVWRDYQHTHQKNFAHHSHVPYYWHWVLLTNQCQYSELSHFLISNTSTSSDAPALACCTPSSMACFLLSSMFFLSVW